jgi:predicted DNA-binding transcriptional regulator AlpA
MGNRVCQQKTAKTASGLLASVEKLARAGARMPADLITTAEAAALLRVAPETLRYWRWRGEGPRSFRVGRRVLYERDDILTWLAAQKTATGRGDTPA